MEVRSACQESYQLAPYRRIPFSRCESCSPALLRSTAHSSSCSLCCNPRRIRRVRSGVAMVRVCVDCHAILGHTCPFCGDSKHKPARTNSLLRTCGYCWKSFDQDSLTGGFCESCFEKRLAKLPKRRQPKMVASVHRNITNPAGVPMRVAGPRGS